MFYQAYAVTRPRTCWICKGKGCSNCNNLGIKQKELLLLSDDKITQQNMVSQKKLKNITGKIVEEEETIDEEKLLEN